MTAPLTALAPPAGATGAPVERAGAPDGRPDREPAGNDASRRSDTAAEVGPGHPKRPAKRKQSLFGFVLELIAIIAVGLMVTTLLRAFVFQPFEVPSGSMENTLQVNDKIVAQRIADFRRGDVVVFADTNGWLAGRPAPGPIRGALEFVGVLPSSGEGHLVKRVVGMPGDRVKCCDAESRITVNNYPLDETAYLYTDSSGRVKPAEQPFEVVVPQGQIFVLGDHRNASGDSRCHLQGISARGGSAGGAAFIPISSVVGSVPVIVSPITRIQRLETPSVFAGVPPPEQAAPSEPLIVQVSEGC